MSFSGHNKRLAVPQRQSPGISQDEREALARQRQWQQQLQSRNIALREEAQDKKEHEARALKALDKEVREYVREVRHEIERAQEEIEAGGPDVEDAKERQAQAEKTLKHGEHARQNIRQRREHERER